MSTIAAAYQDHLTKIITALAGIVVVALFLYGFFLLEAVVYTASRSDAGQEIRTLTSHLADLESQYLLLTKDMTRERAAALGFVPPENVTTVFKTASTHALSLGKD